MRKALQPLNNESGMVLVVAILIMSALILLGSTAVMESTTDLRIAGNYKTNAISFYAAEAGTEEARARLGKGFLPANRIIVDSNTASNAWAPPNIDAGNSLQSALTYTVNIRHKTDPSNQVLYGSYVNGNLVISPTVSADGQNIYLINSSGTSATASKTIETTVIRLLPFPAPAALYVEAATSIQGTSTHIYGTDPPSCGTSNLPGIATTGLASTVTPSGSSTPTVSGSTSSTWSVAGGLANMDIQAMVDNLKGSANYSYSYTANQTDTGMNWGTPVVTGQDNPSSCGVSNIVYYNMNGADIKLAGGSSGCGILLINGNVELNGGFNWYGMILVTGSVTIAGGGDKNITGSVVAGGSTEADLVGGNTSIVYCSKAINDGADRAPLRTLSWTEK